MMFTNVKKINSTPGSPGLRWGGLLIILLGAVYMATLLPGTGYNCDTAKFQYVGHVLGTPHPTGFPTYIFLNHLFTKLFPFGSLAYKANLLSAIFSVLACLFLFLTLSKVFSVKNLAAFVTTLGFGLTYTLWSQSIVAEVYTLHLLFLTMVAYFFLMWRQTRKDFHFFMGCALYALSFGNHLSMILYLPAIVFIVWKTDRRTFTDIKKILWVLLFIVVSALQYSYFFWRYYSPDTAYIEMAVPDLKQFLWHVTGAQYKTRIFAFSLSHVFSNRIPWFFSQILKECFVLIPAAIYGAFKLKNKTTHLFLLLVFLGNAVYAVNYDINDIFVYLIPNYLIAAIYAGLGLDALLKIPTGKKAVLFIGIAFFIIPLALFLANHGKMHTFNSTHHAQKVGNILKIVKKDALIVSPDDFYSQFFWYYLIGENIEARKNIYLVHHFDMNRVKAYIRDDQALYLPEQRKYVPKGLKVYCVHPKHLKQFQQAGFRMLKLRNYLHKVVK
jgi:hypothetical protein